MLNLKLKDGANIVVAAKSVAENPNLPGTIYSAAEDIEKVRNYFHFERFILLNHQIFMLFSKKEAVLF